MKFVIKREDLFNGIKIVESATSMKAIQPILLNIFIETIGDNSIRLVATDLELTVSTIIDAQVEEEGKITLPSKKLNEIVSKLGNKLISFEMAQDETTVNVTCQNAKFEIIGISANEFPQEVCNSELNEEESFEIELKPFTKAIRQAGFAAAGYETSNLLSGIVCDINGEVLEIASTDGNRLARVREKITNKENKVKQLIIPAKTLFELMKITSYMDDETVKLYLEKSKITIKTEKTTMISRILEGQYPKYNQLIPNESPKEAVVPVSAFSSAIDRVSIMVNEKTSIVKFEFIDNTLKLSGDSPEAGNSQDEIDIQYMGEPLTIAFNYKFVLEFLKIVESEEIAVQLNTPLSATVFAPCNDEDYIYLVMPVQLRG